MNGTEQFKQTIKNYLDELAAADELFAATYTKEGKSIDECCNYIIQQVQKSGCIGFTDDEIYGMAVHYYDEDDIKDIPAVDCSRIVVNHVVELSTEDKAEARRKAMDEYYQKCLKEEEAKRKTKPVRKDEQELPSLFAF